MNKFLIKKKNNIKIVSTFKFLIIQKITLFCGVFFFL